jgi:hypothetical protein
MAELTAENYFATGRMYFHAAHALHLHTQGGYPDREYLLPPNYLLVALSIELFLKSFISSRRIKDKELRSSTLRHNLQALYTRAKSLGFEASDVRIDEIISALQGPYEKHHLRYMSDDVSFTKLDLDAVFTVLTSLEDDIAARIGVEVGRIGANG